MPTMNPEQLLILRNQIDAMLMHQTPTYEDLSPQTAVAIVKAHVTWAEMIRKYIKRGKTPELIDPAWAESFEAFFKDMGPKPHNAMFTRINRDLPYTKANCRWQTIASRTEPPAKLKLAS